VRRARDVCRLQHAPPQNSPLPPHLYAPLFLSLPHVSLSLYTALPPPPPASLSPTRLSPPTALPPSPGVTALQLDVKLRDGVPLPLLEEALDRARAARLEILAAIAAVQVPSPSSRVALECVCGVLTRRSLSRLCSTPFSRPFCPSLIAPSYPLYPPVPTKTTPHIHYSRPRARG